MYLDHGNGTYTCGNNVTNALNSLEENENGELVLLKDMVIGGPVNITKDITINLNGHKLTTPVTGTQNVTVKGANVTIKNGKLDLIANQGHIVVDSSEKASTLTIASDVTVNATYYATSAIQIANASNTTVVNINGTWTVKHEIVACSNGLDEKLTVNLNANVKATDLQSDYLVAVDAGTSTVNVLGGTYTSNKSVFMVKNGTLNVKGGDLTANGGHAIVVEKPGQNLTTTLNISAGNITTKTDGKYALYFGSGTGEETGTYSITGGTFTSGKKDKKQLPALYIASQTFLANHANMISGGSFTGAIVGDVQTDAATDTWTRSAAATAILVGNATTTTENGVVTVNPSKAENDKKPAAKPEEQAPNTYDAGLVYMGLALSAIGASVVSVRKLRNN